MDSWDTYLPKNGLKIQPPTMPDTTLSLDSTIEQNGLYAGTLTGAITNNLTVTGRIIVNGENGFQVVIGDLG